MAISKNKERRFRKLQEKSWWLSKGQCPEPDTTYWCGFNHALRALFDNRPSDFYAVRILEKEAEPWE